jgi:membrane protease YdiL (CAAX protease family)
VVKKELNTRYIYTGRSVMVEQSEYPGLESVILLYMLLAAIMIGISVPLILYLEDFYTNNRYLIAPLVNIVSIGIVFILGFKKSKMKLNEIIRYKIPSYYLIFLLIISSFGLTVLFSELNNVIRYFFPMRESAIQSTIDFLVSGNIFLVIFSVGIVIPITEELIFRGLFLNGLLKNYSAATSIITTSILFALLHVSPWGLLSYFLIGVFLSWIFLKTKNLIYCFIVHSLYNLWMVIFIRANILIPGFSDFSDLNRFQPMWLDGLGILITGAGFYLLNHLFSKKPFAS